MAGHVTHRDVPGLAAVGAPIRKGEVLAGEHLFGRSEVEAPFGKGLLPLGLIPGVRVVIVYTKTNPVNVFVYTNMRRSSDSAGALFAAGLCC